MQSNYLDIPHKVHVKESSLPALEQIAQQLGETPQTYFRGSLGLVACWGDLVEYTDRSPDLRHGLVNPASATFLEIDIPNLAAKLPDIIEHANGATVQFPIPFEYLVPIHQASTYYNVSLQKLIRIAASLRADVATRNKAGDNYVFTLDKEYFYEMVIESAMRDYTIN